MYFLTLPAWLPAIVLATPPVIWLLRRLRKARRRRAGCCLACGYDLRASADVCPECGTPVGADAPPATASKGSRWKPSVATSALVVIATGLFFGVRSAWAWWEQPRIPDPVEVEREARKETNPELYAQHPCLVYTAPPEHVVYEEDPKAAAELLKQANYFSSSRARGALVAMYVPTCYLNYRKQSAAWGGEANSKAMLFLHERSSKKGIKRLVIVQCDPEWEPAESMPRYLDWSAETVLPAKDEGIRLPRMNMLFERMSIVQQNPPHIRFFAGQVDPDDDSHFTIRFERDDEKGILDGWLSDDGERVWLLVRDANSKVPKRPPADEQ